MTQARRQFTEIGSSHFLPVNIVRRTDVWLLSPKKQIKKAEIAAIRYYSKTIFTVNYIKFDKKASAKLHGKKYQFIVNVSKEGIVQNPDRMIILKKNRKGIWKVTNEGY